jgi:ParB-like chromosome segregation protein Spo0J
MAENIAANGQLVPGLAAPDTSLPEGHLRLADAHLRRAALKQLGKTHMEVKVAKKALGPAEVVRLMLSTAHRVPLKPSQRGDLYRTYMRERKVDQATAARELGVSTTAISDALLFKNAHPDLKQAADDGQISGSIVEEIIRKFRCPDDQPPVLQEVIALGLAGKRDTAVRFIHQKAGKGKKKAAGKRVTIGTRVASGREALETLKEWAKGLAAEVDRLLKSGLSEAAVFLAVTEKFGLKGGR